MPEDTLPPPPPTDAPPPPTPGDAGPPPPPGDGHRLQVNIEHEMRKSYLDYSMSVIIGRALPDVRDGLKPVHRRVLYAMHSEGLHHTHRYSKCAGVVGEVLKKYHPHGDASVYDALVRLAQEWNLRYPLIDGQGNFGSVDGDPAAAYRYTECRMERLADHLLADIDKDTVDWAPNFDDSTLEPKVLPTRFPNLLVNGSAGIAVGMATNVPPHNLGEVIDAVIHLIANPKATVLDLMRFIPGPDFPTAGIILGRDGIRAAYEKGRGMVQVRARASIEVHPKTERESIVVTEIPYQVNKAKLVEHIADLVRDKRLEGISDLRDESSREGMRVVIELKRDAVAQVVLNNLYAHTQLQTNFGVIMLAIDGGQPRVLTLKEMLERFVAHRRDVVVRRTRHELRKAREREHILLGLQIALDHIDEIIELIKKAGDRESARVGLMERFGLSELQAKAILEMQLQRLTGLERQKILDELAELQRLIAEYLEILNSEKTLRAVIVKELKEVQKEFGDERRTQIVEDVGEIRLEDLIQQEDVVVTVTRGGYLKRTSLDTYRRQTRGGKGRLGMVTRGEDREMCVQLFRAGLYEGLYDPRLTVRHYVPEQRMSRRYFRRWYFWHGRTLARMADSFYIDLDLSHVPHVARVPRFMYRELLGHLRHWVSSIACGDALGTLVSELHLIEYAGFFVESWRPYRPQPSTAQRREAVGAGMVSICDQRSGAELNPDPDPACAESRGSWAARV